MRSLIKFVLPGIILTALLMLFSCEKDNNEGTVTDFEGNVYRTVQIGDQWWMADNLKATKFNDGQSILNVTDDSEWNNLTTSAYCWYNNDEAGYKNTYGALYNWHAVSTGRLCPDGWHVPSNSEWATLTSRLGGENVAGGKLKETGTAHWQTPNSGATDLFSFTALPGGYRGSLGAFIDILDRGYWWSSTEYNATHAHLKNLTYDSGNFTSLNDAKKFGFSVRCIKD